MDSRTQRASGTVVDPRASLAMWLRTGRTQRNLSLQDVARITKIQTRILEKLENGNLEGLPADVFVKGFVRSFAKCVGLDEREALDRLGAAQSGQATAVAKAFVDSMSVRLVQPTAATPSALVEPVIAEPAGVIEVAALAPVVEIVEVVETTPLVELAPVVETEAVSIAADVAADDEPKKKRSRKKSPTAAPRSRKKKSTGSAELQAAASHTAIEQTAIEQTVIEQTVIEQAVIEQAVIEQAPVAPLIDDAAVEAPALAEGSQRISASKIEIAVVADDEMLSADTIESIDALRETDTTDTTGSWQPTMPALSTAPSVPWRRPQIPTQSTYVVPHMVIDDADPDSADREREREQRASRDHSRLSFLPPILLDREDRSARQGGLTLAVIILLIAATLTLSYLMRRPSARGDGVTLLDGSSTISFSVVG